MRIGPLLIVASATQVGFAGLALAQSTCPSTPAVSITSPDLPTDVCIPTGFPSNQNPIEFFDDFSWKSFVSLIWPALPQKRGEPDRSKNVNDVAGPRVFETFKADWELYQAQPTEWSKISNADPCNSHALQWGDFVLASFAKFGNLGEAGFPDLSHALPAQNKTWVRYATSFNQPIYSKIFNDQLYVMSKLQAAPPLTFENGSITIKSAWIDMDNVAQKERYYRRIVKFMKTDGTCLDKEVGLIGMHVVQKTPSRPQWIWSSFEHVDNVSPEGQDGPNPTRPMAFNDGTGTAMPTQDPNGGFPPISWDNPQVYNVTRFKPIHPSTKTTNDHYRNALVGVWSNYQLVLTQWPVPPQGTPSTGPVPATQDGGPSHTFPGSAASSAFANTVLETWMQKSISTGCMACHDITTQGLPSTDFVWTAQTHPISPNVAPFAMRLKNLSNLKTLREILK
jgi:hypothetical protein